VPTGAFSFANRRNTTLYRKVFWLKGKRQGRGEPAEGATREHRKNAAEGETFIAPNQPLCATKSRLSPESYNGLRGGGSSRGRSRNQTANQCSTESRSPGRPAGGRFPSSTPSHTLVSRRDESRRGPVVYGEEGKGTARWHRAKPKEEASLAKKGGTLNKFDAAFKRGARLKKKSPRTTRCESDREKAIGGKAKKERAKLSRRNCTYTSRGGKASLSQGLHRE